MILLSLFQVYFVLTFFFIFILLCLFEVWIKARDNLFKRLPSRRTSKDLKHNIVFRIRVVTNTIHLARVMRDYFYDL